MEWKGVFPGYQQPELSFSRASDSSRPSRGVTYETGPGGVSAAEQRDLINWIKSLNSQDNLDS